MENETTRTNPETTQPHPTNSAAALLSIGLQDELPPDDDSTIIVLPPSNVRDVTIGEKPGDYIGRYCLREVLGEGGFGMVWLAEQFEPIHREVALKVIKAGMDSREIISRFNTERQALALMDHPNIAGVLDAGATSRGRPFFVMEVVKGPAITKYCDQKRLTVRQRLELFIPICQAVQHAHQKAILHRDLKPSNILVTEVDGKPVPMVIDFGIAKALNCTQEQMLRSSLARTQDGVVVGTPQYMSPEQASGVPDVDTRSDIYTLGVILYELLTGETPLTRKQLEQATFDEMLRLVRECEAKRPSSRYVPISELSKTTAAVRHDNPRRLSQAIRGDLDWITLKALEKDKERRYGTAAALAIDLERHLKCETVEAGPPSAVYRFNKFVKRNKLVFAIATALFTLLTVGITVSVWQWHEAVLARHAAENHAEETRLERRRAVQSLALNEFRMANRASELHDHDIALAHLAQAIRLDPSQPQALRRIGSYLVQRTWSEIGKMSRRFPSSQKNNFDIILGISFSPDSSRILVSMEGGQVYYLTTDTLAAVLPATPFVAFKEHVGGTTFSPDGKWFAVAHGSRVSLYTADSMEEHTNESASASEVCSVAFDSKSERLVIAHDDGMIAVRQVSSAITPQRAISKVPGVRLAAFDNSTETVVYLAFEESDVRRIGVVIFGRLHLSSESRPFDVQTPTVNLLAKHFSSQVGMLLALKDPPGGRPRYDRTSYYGDASRYANYGYPFLQSLEGKLNFALSPDGKLRVKSGYANVEVLSTDKNSETELPKSTFLQDAFIVCSTFSPDSRLFATAGNDNTARIWELSTGKLLLDYLNHPGQVYSIKFSPDSRLLATMSHDFSTKEKLLTIWKLAPESPLPPVACPSLDPEGTSAFLPAVAGRHPWFAYLEKNGALWIINAETGEPTGAQPLVVSGVSEIAQRGHSTSLFYPPYIRGVTSRPVFHQNGKLLIAWSPKVILAWNLEDARSAYTLNPRGLGNFESVAFAQERNLLLTIEEGGEIQVYNATSGAPISETHLSHKCPEQLGISIQQNELLIWHKDNSSQKIDKPRFTFKRFDVMTLRQIGSSSSIEGYRVAGMHASRGTVTAVVHSLPGRFENNSNKRIEPNLRVWDVFAGVPLSPELHDVIDSEMPYTPFKSDGTAFLSALNGAARLISPRGDILKTFSEPNLVGHVELSPDGRSVLIEADREQLFHVFDSNSGQILSQFTGRIAASDPAIGRMSWSPPLKFSSDSRILVNADLLDMETGFPLCEPIGGLITILDDHGDYVLTQSIGANATKPRQPASAAIVRFPKPPLEAPVWLPELLECLAGIHIDDNGNAGPSGDDAIWNHLGSELSKAEPGDEFTKIARRLLSKRKINPNRN